MYLIGKESCVVNGKYLLDSNIVIRLSKGEYTLVEFFDNNESFAISVITYMEVLGYNFQNASEVDFINEILSLMEVAYIDEDVANRTIEIRKMVKIKLPDAIIAATALVLDLELVTANYNDFAGIKDLKLLRK